MQCIFSLIVTWPTSSPFLEYPFCLRADKHSVGYILNGGASVTLSFLKLIRFRLLTERIWIYNEQHWKQYWECTEKHVQRFLWNRNGELRGKSHQYYWIHSDHFGVPYWKSSADMHRKKEQSTQYHNVSPDHKHGRRRYLGYRLQHAWKTGQADNRKVPLVWWGSRSYRV